MPDLKARRIDGYYCTGGKRYPSVTTIIGAMASKGGLEQWKKKNKNWKELRDNAALTGTLMHLRILQAYSEAQIEMPGLAPIEMWTEDIFEELNMRMKSWNKLALRIKNALVEHTIFITIPGAEAAGSLDMRGEIEGFNAILDLKSSKRIYPSQRIQVGGYAVGSEEQGFYAERGFIVALRGDQIEIDEMEKDEMEEAKEAFIEMSKKYHKLYP